MSHTDNLPSWKTQVQFHKQKAMVVSLLLNEIRVKTS